MIIQTATKPDINGAPYPTPHWTNDESGLVVQSSPTLYPSGSLVQTVTGFMVDGGGFPVVIKGEASGGSTTFTLWATNAPNGINWTVGTVADAALAANTVDFYNPMTIKWSYGATDKSVFVDAGGSTNQVYVSWKTPTNGVQLLHTVVDVACSNAIG